MEPLSNQVMSNQSIGTSCLTICIAKSIFNSRHDPQQMYSTSPTSTAHPYLQARQTTLLVISCSRSATSLIICYTYSALIGCFPPACIPTIIAAPAHINLSSPREPSSFPTRHIDLAGPGFVLLIFPLSSLPRSTSSALYQKFIISTSTMRFLCLHGASTNGEVCDPTRPSFPELPIDQI